MAGLSLPQDLEPYVDGYGELHSPGAYCLCLSRPVDLQDRWERHYDMKPPYWDELVNSEKCVYVGGTSDLLSRLEDHRDGEVRQTALTQVCGIEKLQTVWVADSRGEAVNLREPQLARLLSEEHPEWFVHQR